MIGPTLVFKGGTCLIKCYLDYPRFSTDLDFTWRPVPTWDALGTKELRRALRPVQRTLADRLKEHAASQGFAFDPWLDIQYGHRNRMMTALLRYESIARLPGLIKVLGNVDALSERVAHELRTLAHFLQGTPMLVGERSGAGATLPDRGTVS